MNRRKAVLIACLAPFSKAQEQKKTFSFPTQSDNLILTNPSPIDWGVSLTNMKTFSIDIDGEKIATYTMNELREIFKEDTEKLKLMNKHE